MLVFIFLVHLDMGFEVSVILKSFLGPADAAEVDDVPIGRISNSIFSLLMQHDCRFALANKMTAADSATITSQALGHGDHVAPEQLVGALISDHVRVLILHVI